MRSAAPPLAFGVVRGAAEDPGRRPGHLVGWDVAQMLGDSPAVAVRVDDLAEPLAAEGVGQRVEDFGSGVESALPCRVGVVGVDHERAVRAVNGLRRYDAPLWELTGQSDSGFGDG